MRDYRTDQVNRGYFVPYNGAGTRCPGCGRSHWHVGRMMAECAFCMTALSLPESAALGSGIYRRRVAA